MNSDVELRAVKPLAWQENGKHHPDSVWTGELFGLRTYYAIEPEDRVFRLERGWFLSEAGRDDLGLFPTRAEAERHANDDWQARLSPAIERQQVEGFVLVPRDITEEMWSAFFKARDEIFPEQMERLRSQGRGWKGLPAVVWEAMIAASPSPDNAGGWIEWKGGAQPLPDNTLIYWKLWQNGKGTICGPGYPKGLHWEHSPSGFHYNDIIAYRVVPPTPEAPSTNLEHKETAE